MSTANKNFKLKRATENDSSRNYEDFLSPVSTATYPYFLPSSEHFSAEIFVYRL
jgi:hypothetical protein